MTRTHKTAFAALVIMIVATSCQAHWEPPPAVFPWADPGSVRWMIDYATMDETQVGFLLDAGFNLVQGGAFTPEAMEDAREAGAHRMMYICSRTIYHEKLFPEHPELRDAAILTPEGEYKIIYNNPARYAGCYNRPAWLEYIEGRMDALQEIGVDCIFFDNPMTWPCYCPTCREKFRAYSREHTGAAYELGAEGTPAELERWFTLDTARDFFTQIHEYAHNRERPLFMVVNNLTYWLIDQGVVDGVFTEAFAHPPFGRDIAACKIGLASSHGRPTGFLSYVPGAVRKARGVERYHAPGAGNMWVALPIAEEYALGCATGIALGGNYMPNMSLNGDRNVLAMTKPDMDRPILEACAEYADFARCWETLLADQRAGSRVGVLFDLTWGPRSGQTLGLDRGNINNLLWLLQSEGVPADVVVNSDLIDHGLDDYDALLIDDQAMLSPEEMTGLRTFVERGGTLVLTAALQIRDRFEPPDASRSISEFLPDLVDALQIQESALDLTMDGYEADGSRIKAATEGTASMRFTGEPGLWQIGVSYLDESDGQSSYEVLVDGETVGGWTADADDDEWHSFTTTPMELAAGSTITIHGVAGGGEYARIQSISLRSRASEASYEQVTLGAGRALQFAEALQDLHEDERMIAMSALREVAPVTGSWPQTVLVNVLRQPEGGIVSAHIVNHDFEYDEHYALAAIHPTPEITLHVANDALTVAWLITPGAEPTPLPIVGGAVTAPPIETYAAILLAPDAMVLEALTAESTGRQIDEDARLDEPAARADPAA